MFFHFFPHAFSLFFSFKIIFFIFLFFVFMFFFQNYFCQFYFFTIKLVDNLTL
jgi:hypothetical protein